MSSQRTLAALRLLSERQVECVVVGMVAGVPDDARDIDLLGALAGNETYDDLLPSSELLQLGEGLQTRVVSLPALIDLERKTARPKDLAVLPLLEATLAERARLQRN